MPSGVFRVIDGALLEVLPQKAVPASAGVSGPVDGSARRDDLVRQRAGRVAHSWNRNSKRYVPDPTNHSD